MTASRACLARTWNAPGRAFGIRRARREMTLNAGL
jgi:hypothetical protein